MSETQTHATKESRERDRHEVLGIDRDTAADFSSGIAKAIAEGFRAYAEEIDAGNVFKFGPGGGMFDGFVAGWANFFDELAKTSRRALDDAKDTRKRHEHRREHTAEPIDYERLAHLVAAEMQKTAAKKQ